MIGPKSIDNRTQAQIDRDANIAYELVTLRDHNLCVRCGKPECRPVQRDHRKNRSQGGEDVPSNLQCLGLPCHVWKSEHPRDAIAEGFGVPGWATPADWPARRLIRDQGRVFLIWCMYSDDGVVTEISKREAEQRMREEI